MRVFGRSLLVLLALYALVFAAGEIYLARHDAPLWARVLLPVLIVLVQYGAAPLLIEWMIVIRWDDSGTELPARNREFLERLCAERGLKMPRIGIIDNAAPNAFAFGHARADARIAVTTGLLATLSAEEVNAVLAHEMGHVEHWDFVILTLAVLAPLILWHLYFLARRSQKTDTIAAGTYICYWISRLVLLLLNRTREFRADQHAAAVTREPGALASALLKISYGMAKADGDLREAMEATSGKERRQLAGARRLAGAVALMGISNCRSGAALALGGADGQHTAAILQWDLVNPWARLYELNSTHPLTALRIQALNRESEALQQGVACPLPAGGPRPWRTFRLEVLIWAGPWIWIGVLATLGLLRDRLVHFGIRIPQGLGPFLLILIGVTWILRTGFRYSGSFEPATIGSLLADAEVSPVRPRAVRLEGEIMGFGVPGAFWCPDLVLRDETGMVFVLYRQSIPFARLLFALTNAGSYIGRRVVIEGWFRRGVRPYVEMASMSGINGKTHRGYSCWVQYGVATGLVATGCWWLFG